MYAGLRASNLYGPTETSDITTVAVDLRDHPAPPAGHPIPGRGLCEEIRSFFLLALVSAWTQINKHARNYELKVKEMCIANGIMRKFHAKCTKMK